MVLIWKMNHVDKDIQAQVQIQADLPHSEYDRPLSNEFERNLPAPIFQIIVKTPGILSV